VDEQFSEKDFAHFAHFDPLFSEKEKKIKFRENFFP